MKIEWNFDKIKKQQVNVGDYSRTFSAISLDVLDVDS